MSYEAKKWILTKFLLDLPLQDSRVPRPRLRQDKDSDIEDQHCGN